MLRTGCQLQLIGGKALIFFGLDSVIKCIQWNSISFGKRTECFHHMMYEVSAKGCKNSQVWSHAYIATCASSILQIHGCWWALSSIQVILLKWFHSETVSTPSNLALQEKRKIPQKRATCLRTKRTSATGQSLISLSEVCNPFWQRSLCGGGEKGSVFRLVYSGIKGWMMFSGIVKAIKE